MKRLIVFLIRRKLGLKKHERFRFVGQKSNAVYYFATDSLIKCWKGQTMLSGVSLNWLLDDECKIDKEISA